MEEGGSVGDRGEWTVRMWVTEEGGERECAWLSKVEGGNVGGGGSWIMGMWVVEGGEWETVGVWV